MVWVVPPETDFKTRIPGPVVHVRFTYLLPLPYLALKINNNHWFAHNFTIWASAGAAPLGLEDAFPKEPASWCKLLSASSEIPSFTGLEAKGPKSMWHQHWFLPGGSEGESASGLSPSFWGLPAILGILWPLLHHSKLSLCYDMAYLCISLCLHLLLLRGHLWLDLGPT